MSTSCSITFGLVDVTAKSDTTVEIIDKQDFIDPQDLALDGVYAPKVATGEENYWKLDGSFRVFPNNPEDTTWGIWSLQMSNQEGAFETPIELTLQMSELHSSIGLSFEFDPYGDNYCNDMDITWYKNNEVLYSANYKPNYWEFTVDQQVENYNKIVVVFYGANRPYRYLKVQNIIHGVQMVFDEKVIKSARLMEEADLDSGGIAVNSLDFTVYSDSDDFNIFNPTGIYKLLQRKQQLNVRGIVHGENLSMGTFFVDSWESTENNSFNIKANDSIGLMDMTYFNGGLYTNIMSQTLISAIMTSAGLGYTLNEELTNIPITGWIPYCTHREALQQVVFVVGGYVDTSRTGTVKIETYNIPTSVDSLTYADKFFGSTARLSSLVTGINVIAHGYSRETDRTQAYNGNLPIGKHKIAFSSPYTGLSTTGATITELGVNYAIITVTTAGEVVVTGYKYEDNETVFRAELPEIPAGEYENTLEVTNATLVNVSNAAAVAQRILTFYQKRINQSEKWILRGETVGDTLNVEVMPGVYRRAIIKSLNIDLIGGFMTEGELLSE